MTTAREELFLSSVKLLSLINERAFAAQRKLRCDVIFWKIIDRVEELERKAHLPGKNAGDQYCRHRR